MTQALATQSKLSTGIDDLDDSLDGGITRSQVCEIYGCPGAGKTALGMQIAARVVACENLVVWLECSQRFPATRIRNFLDAETYNAERALLSRVKCYRTATLNDLLVFLLHTDLTDVIPEQTKLLVIDDLTTLYNTAFPPETIRKDSGRYIEPTTSKKQRVLALLGNSLSSLASSKGIAIIVLNNLTTKITGGQANLTSPFNETWSNMCATRLLLYRDKDKRWLAVQRTNHRTAVTPTVHEVSLISAGFVSQSRPNKRLKVADSESDS